MKMATVLCWSLAACLGGAAPQVAHAEINCTILGSDNTPYVCVNNKTSLPINGIQCSGWMTSNVNIPKGRIPPGSTTIIKFDAGRCAKQIDFLGPNGNTLATVKGFDFKANSDLDVGN